MSQGKPSISPRVARSSGSFSPDANCSDSSNHDNRVNSGLSPSCCRSEQPRPEQGPTVVILPPQAVHSPNACLTTSGSGGDLDGSFSSSDRSDPITDQFVTKKGLIFKNNSNKKKEKDPVVHGKAPSRFALFSQPPLRGAQSSPSSKSQTASTTVTSTGVASGATRERTNERVTGSRESGSGQVLAGDCDENMKRSAERTIESVMGDARDSLRNDDVHVHNRQMNGDLRTTRGQPPLAKVPTLEKDDDNRESPRARRDDSAIGPDEATVFACPLEKHTASVGHWQASKATDPTSFNTLPMVNGSCVSNGRHASSQDSMSAGAMARVQTGNMECVAILDCGAQFGKVIDRRIREKNVLSEMLPLNTPASKLISDGRYKAIIVSGGPNSVYAVNAPAFDPEIFRCGLPVLGICYGFQLLNRSFGGGVAREAIREDGQTEVELDNRDCPLFTGLDTKERVLLTHGDSVTEKTVAEGFRVIATSGTLVAGIASIERRLYGVQFHPEVDLTENGRLIFENFLYAIAGCKGGYTMENREMMCIEEIRRVVGEDKKVLVMVSGGVDSTVCAALLHRALGAERVIAVHIDNGFMRHRESEQVMQSLNALRPPMNVHIAQSRMEFLHGTVTVQGIESVALHSCTDPEIKRRIIGDTFMRVKDRVMDELKLDQSQIVLAQGTLRPDLIESASAIASGHADAIKTHHNDTGLVRELRDLGRVIEPLKDFHKDEVRELGEALGLPGDIVHRHPFPGPGLAIRIICAIKPHMCQDFKTTQKRLQQIANLAETAQNDGILSQYGFQPEAFATISHCISTAERTTLMAAAGDLHIATTLLPVKTVGVQGDSRSYSYVAALSTDVIPVPWALLERLARLIPRLLHNINRVVYVFGESIKQPVLDVTPTLLNAITIDQLQRADKAAMDVLFARDSRGRRVAYRKPSIGLIQQMPVVLVPVHFDRELGDVSVRRSVCMRPFLTADFMTGLAALPGRDIPEQLVAELVERIRAETPMLSRVMIDLTSKPPGTTEWE